MKKNSIIIRLHQKIGYLQENDVIRVFLDNDDRYYLLYSDEGSIQSKKIDIDLLQYSVESVTCEEIKNITDSNALIKEYAIDEDFFLEMMREMGLQNPDWNGYSSDEHQSDMSGAMRAFKLHWIEREFDDDTMRGYGSIYFKGDFLGVFVQGYEREDVFLVSHNIAMDAKDHIKTFFRDGKINIVAPDFDVLHYILD